VTGANLKFIEEPVFI